MKKILFPTDFSDTAAHAFGYALELAEEMDARVDLLHVYHLSAGEASNMPPEFIQTMLDDLEKHVEEKLEQFIEGYPDKRIGEKKSVHGLFMYQDISDFARVNDYDIIVMGTKGKRRHLEKLMGCVTTHTMMNAPCPVLAVPEEADYRTIGSIAYATDFQPSDEHALEQLMDFAGIVGAEVHFVHVETEPLIGSYEEVLDLKNYPFKITDFSVVNSPTIMEGLERYIEENDIELLALFIPRRRLWERLFHSSFTKKMTFHTKIPLLVFHE